MFGLVGAKSLLGVRINQRPIGTLLIKIFKISIFRTTLINFMLQHALSPIFMLVMLLVGQIKRFEKSSKMAIFSPENFEIPATRRRKRHSQNFCLPNTTPGMYFQNIHQPQNHADHFLKISLVHTLKIYTRMCQH